jgi:hypothetical protein
MNFILICGKCNNQVVKIRFENRLLLCLQNLFYLRTK